MGQKVTFDEINKIIDITQAPDGDGEIFIDVKQDLYSDGKEDWVVTETLRKFIFPIVAVGGNPLPGSKELGSTFFLAADWKIKPYSANHRLTINGNLYSADGSDPFLDPDGSFTVRIMQQVSSLVDSIVQQLPEIEYASFEGGVTVDLTSSWSGTVFPIGTPRRPVNNFADALLIAADRGFTKFYIVGNAAVDGANDFDGFMFMGESMTKTELNISDAASTVGCEFCESTVFGFLDGDCAMHGSKIINLSYISGVIEHCLLGDGTIVLGGGADTHFIDCWSGVAGSGTPTIDMGGSGQNLGLRNYNGGVTIKNLSGPNKISIDANSARIVLDSTITDGEIIIRGAGELVDNSGGTATVDTSGFISHTEISNSVWDDDISGRYVVNSAATALKAVTYESAVSIDVVNGVPGTGWPVGTHFEPVNNLDDALDIMSRGNVDILLLHSALTIEAAHNIDGLVVETHGLMGTTVTFVTGCSAHKTAFRYVDLEGDLTNGDQLLVENCSIGNLSNFTGIMNNVAWGQGAEISIGLWATIIQATSGGDPTNEPELNIGTAAVNVASYTGNLKLTGKTGSNRTVINLTSGNIIIDASCVAGTIQILGTGIIEADNSGPGCNVDLEGFISLENITMEMGADLKRVLGLMHENIFIDQPVYDDDNNLESARVRIYSTAGSVGTDSNVLATYTITAPGSGPGKFLSWKQVIV